MTILSRIGAVRDGDRAHSVARNLQAVLNTKRGYGGTRPELGLTEHDIDGPAETPRERLAADVEAQIRAFEPRLSAPRVTLLRGDEPPWVRMIVEGRLRARICRLLVRFDTMLRCAEVSVLSEVDR